MTKTSIIAFAAAMTIGGAGAYACDMGKTADATPSGFILAQAGTTGAEAQSPTGTTMGTSGTTTPGTITSTGSRDTSSGDRGLWGGPSRADTPAEAATTGASATRSLPAVTSGNTPGGASDQTGGAHGSTKSGVNDTIRDNTQGTATGTMGRDMTR